MGKRLAALAGHGSHDGASELTEHRTKLMSWQTPLHLQIGHEVVRKRFEDSDARQRPTPNLARHGALEANSFPGNLAKWQATS